MSFSDAKRTYHVACEKITNKFPNPALTGSPGYTYKDASIINEFSESAVVGRYLPLSHLLRTTFTGYGESFVFAKAGFRHSYANNLCMFTNR